MVLLFINCCIVECSGYYCLSNSFVILHNNMPIEHVLAKPPWGPPKIFVGQNTQKFYFIHESIMHSRMYHYPYWVFFKVVR